MNFFVEQIILFIVPSAIAHLHLKAAHLNQSLTLEKLKYIVTAEPFPADNARIDFILTNNPSYATAKGIRPGSLLQDAVSAYGSVRLYYSPDVEYAQFQGQPYNTTSEMGFWVAAP